MANRYKRKEILEALYTMMLDVVPEVYTTDRPAVKDSSSQWAIVSLPYGINAESSVHNYAFARIQLFYKDRENGIENVASGEELVDKTLEAMGEQLVEGGRYGDFMTCNKEPRVIYFKSDHMGYHAIAIQFELIISFLNN
jgi:hypothetical protein